MSAGYVNKQLFSLFAESTEKGDNMSFCWGHGSFLLPPSGQKTKQVIAGLMCVFADFMTVLYVWERILGNEGKIQRAIILKIPLVATVAAVQQLLRGLLLMEITFVCVSVVVLTQHCFLLACFTNICDWSLSMIKIWPWKPCFLFLLFLQGKH